MAWRTIVSTQQDQNATQIARCLGNRLRDSLCNVEIDGDSAWSLASGYPGIAIAFEWLDRCFPNEQWDLSSRSCLSKAAKALENSVGQAPQPGLFNGLAGYAYAAHLASRGGIRYAKLLATLHAQTINYGQALLTELRYSSAFPTRLFDLVSGATGIGAYALATLALPGSHSLLDSCVASLAPTSAIDDNWERFITPPSQIVGSAMRACYPNGYTDCGVAHGLPGVLAYLSKVSLSVGRTETLDKNITSLAAWVMSQRSPRSSGNLWPWGSPTPGFAISFQPARTAWCYGNPGVARSLFLAGLATDDTALVKLAEEALSAAYVHDGFPDQSIPPSFCHGLAGILQITQRFANDTSTPVFFRASERLLEALLTAFDPSLPFGFYNEGDLAERDLLEGTAGILLVLLATAFPYEPTWDEIFLVS